MANHKPAPSSLLMSLPLEVRHTIFEYAAERKYKPKKLLRYWFEKKEFNLVAVQHYPNGPTPRRVHDSEDGDDSDAPEQENDESGDGGNNDDVDDDDDDDNDDDDQAEDDDDDEDDNQDENDEAGDNAQEDNGGADSTPPAPLIRVARKWRYIPKFMRFTHSPPPVELLLTSKWLNKEAKDWFYDVAFLQIIVTGSFAHTSFFEEAFTQITDAAFSPMENIRRAKIVFVWDTTWLRSESTGYASAILPALLHQRANFVYQILLKAPDLRELFIHWHDTAQDNESANFMLDILAPFHSLNTDIKIIENYVAPDVEPDERSIAGVQRAEFKDIFANGLDRLN
ncbi:hypothetical protein GQ44DRAFT_756851 [Phaeosphaeriaceae sp. PMI808]|nr:hypothetical protein GQ44DRAFT_756851 [Phaeosphaeriaceae sp. PMI808]